MDRERAVALIYEAIDIVNQQLPIAKRLAHSQATVIVGAGGALDSLGIVNFVLAIEEKVGEALRRPVQLFDPDWLADAGSPIGTVGSLTTYLMTLTSR